jgi:predicted phosphodiesterase
MRVAIFSDVHGNLSALRVVLDHIENKPAIDRVVFAGDACLFGPRPLECIDELRNRDIDCLVGNTDDWIINPPLVDDRLDEEAALRRSELRAFCQWTRERLDGESISWLEKLQDSFDLRYSPTLSPDDDLLIVHANPRDLLQVIFPSEEHQRALYGRIRQSDEELEPLLKDVRASAIAFGHLHIPGSRRWRDISLANISSVSFPGDGDQRAKYAIASWSQRGGWEFEWFHVIYSIRDEISAYEVCKPPGWEQSMESLLERGLIAQAV